MVLGCAEALHITLKTNSILLSQALPNEIPLRIAKGALYLTRRPFFGSTLGLMDPHVFVLTQIEGQAVSEYPLLSWDSDVAWDHFNSHLERPIKGFGPIFSSLNQLSNFDYDIMHSVYEIFKWVERIKFLILLIWQINWHVYVKRQAFQSQEK